MELEAPFAGKIRLARNYLLDFGGGIGHEADRQAEGDWILCTDDSAETAKKVLPDDVERSRRPRTSS
jgi:hypothetical protein